MDRLTVGNRHKLLEHAIDNPLVFFEVLPRVGEPCCVAFVLFRPAPSRDCALHGPHGDRRSINAKEPLRGSTEYSVAAEIDVGTVAPALGEDEISIELVQIAADGCIERERVIHLLELIGGDEASDSAYVLPVLILVHRRDPRRDRVRRGIHPGLSDKERHFNPFTKQTKPREGQIRERLMLITGANGKRTVECRSRVVRDEADRPVSFPGCHLSLLENADHLVEAVRRDLALRIGEFHRSPAGHAELIESCVRH